MPILASPKGGDTESANNGIIVLLPVEIPCYESCDFSCQTHRQACIILRQTTYSLGLKSEEGERNGIFMWKCKEMV